MEDESCTPNLVPHISLLTCLDVRKTFLAKPNNNLVFNRFIGMENTIISDYVGRCRLLLNPILKMMLLDQFLELHLYNLFLLVIFWFILNSYDSRTGVVGVVKLSLFYLLKRVRAKLTNTVHSVFTCATVCNPLSSLHCNFNGT